ncbi:phage head-tail connector protein [Murdochiella massiliensis]|uniref:phage head-tail connector protein n=1 Tax=Murdochiella massiliensis TaxID=1673723 RepID=UPI000831BF2E|nr:phage head-tail connector protein [Murdochiella massiliensis]
MQAVDKAKALIFFNDEPTDGQAKLLLSIGEIVEARILGRLFALMEKPPDSVPSELEYVVVELIVRRFNRVGSEGLESESISGHKAEYKADGLDGFEDDIKEWAKAHDEWTGKRGKVRFL